MSPTRPLVLTAVSVLFLSGCSFKPTEHTAAPSPAAAPTRVAEPLPQETSPEPPVVSGTEDLQSAASHDRIRERYRSFLIGNDQTFSGEWGQQAGEQFLKLLRQRIQWARSFDFTLDPGKPFRLFPGEEGYQEEFEIYSRVLQQFVLPLAYAYTVDAPGSPYYRDPEILDLYVKSLDYLHSRGVRKGVTFHRNYHRMMEMEGAPVPPEGVSNLVNMSLRMGAYCQSVLLMRPYIQDTDTYQVARETIRHLEVLGRYSGHVRYYIPTVAPEGLENWVQCDSVQNYSDTALVSALLEEDPDRRKEMLQGAQALFTDSLKIVPGWADTIKPDFTGFHHRAMYGNAYSGGFIPQAAFGVYLLSGTEYAVAEPSVRNLENLILTYRLYCQKYSMPFGIRGRFPSHTHQLAEQVFSGILMMISTPEGSSGALPGVFARLWDPEAVGIDFLFNGGRGKLFRGFQTLNMLNEQLAANHEAEPDPSGFWMKPYGGLALHRRDNWMAAVKGYSKYIWDFEAGKKPENFYGQYLSHGSLTLFTEGDPVSDIASGYDLKRGWDWYRMPGTTAVHFPVRPVNKAPGHRFFSPETFLGGVSLRGEHGVWSMILNQETFSDGTPIHLRAHKSVFCVDNTLVLIGSGISGGDGVHPVETTLFQSVLPEGSTFAFNRNQLQDPAGNTYRVFAGKLRAHLGTQHSVREDGRTPSSGEVAVAWIDHGLSPDKGVYGVTIGVQGPPAAAHTLVRADETIHHVHFQDQKLHAAAVFQSGVTPTLPRIREVSAPCLVMLEEQTDGIHLALTNPDLGLLPADAPPPTFRWFSEGHNAFTPAEPRPVEVVLEGNWSLAEENPALQVLPSDAGTTRLRFDCLNGMTLEGTLKSD